MSKPLPPTGANSLRQRLIEDMNLRGFSAKMQRYYIGIALWGVLGPLTAGSFFGDFRAPASVRTLHADSSPTSVRNSSRKRPVRFQGSRS
jgi:hypothetical protein